MKKDDLFKILLDENPIKKIKENEHELFEFIPELKICKGFDQKNEWHIYDVYEHTLHVVENVPNIIDLRLAALFHDIGKPNMFFIDENGVGHFYGHYKESKKIFDEFSIKNNLEEKLSKNVSNLIYYHDIKISKLNEEELNVLINTFSIDEIKMLFNLKKSDLLAHNPKYHYLQNEREKEKEMIFKKYRR